MNTVFKRKLPQTGALFLVWTFFGLFMFTQSLAQNLRMPSSPFPWWHYLVSWMVGVYIWFLITPLVLWLGRRFPLQRKHWIRGTCRHLLFCIVLGFLQLGFESAVLYRLRLFPTILTSYGNTFGFLVVIGYHQSVMTYWTVLAIQYAFGWYNRYQERRQEALRLELHLAQLQKQLVEATLSALKMQLQPHFLFNTMNAIMVLVRQQKNHEAEEMIARLSDLLRCVLDDVKAQEVPLRRELEYLQLYLSIEEVRFQDRLHVDIAADPGLLDAAVPHMVLQPLVENAIKHGIGRSSSAGSIQISACQVGGKMEIKVLDDGPGLGSANPIETSGVGLANTRARLAQLYGDAAQFSMENGEHGGAVATMLLPCRMEGSHAPNGVAG